MYERELTLDELLNEPVIRKVMAEAPLPAVKLSVPLGVDARAAGNWDEAH